MSRYSVLLSLSIVVAAVGLLQNSIAVVIGAMLIAPLMAPIIGLAASLVMGWRRQVMHGLLLVGGSVIGATAIAWAIAKFLPDSGLGLPTEVLARTSPDVRDLLVALAAGAAGAYATIRRDVSVALPGVAVAVALVPPLGAIGVLIARDQPDLARGAAMLFVTNMVGIVLAAAIVFVLSGLVPKHSLRNSRRRIVITLALVSVPTVVLAVVLTNRFIQSADAALRLRLASNAVSDWLGPGYDLNRIKMTGSTVQVNVSGRVSPPPVQSLTDSLDAVLGESTAVDLRWTPVSDPNAVVSTRQVVGLNELQPLVQGWLNQQALTLDGLSYDSSTLVVTASGFEPPTSSDGLATLIFNTFGTHPLISFVWTRIEPTASPTEIPATPPILSNPADTSTPAAP
ncbi:MAG TPA: DUF389 domain-containing protein [Candidatus Nanopelagicaceae bacterium]|nr:DUF389 domain-containing protein [Candidatus Nanopelagicaceae bacterium]